MPYTKPMTQKLTPKESNMEYGIIHYGTTAYQCSSLGSKFVVIGVVCCQEMWRYALFHKVLRGLAKYFG